MFKRYDTKSCEIIILIAVLFLPIKGNAQTKNNKIPSNTQNIKSPTLQQKQTIKTRNPKAPLPKPKKLPLTAKDLEKKLLVANTGLANANKAIKDLEKKLLAANTGLANANKAVAQKNREISKLNQDMNNLLDELDDLDKNLIFQEDTSKNYKKLISCYKNALFTWHGMNSKKGLTKYDHLVINVELRDSLFRCPPI
tara:strand:- start:322 stop:912 length:591 start_codon:yes stop_codon:yes gene_type:complete